MQYQIQLEKREAGSKALAATREAGNIPGVVYGADREVISVATKAIPFAKLYAAAGGSALIDATIDGAAPVKVLVQDVQINPLKGEVIHVDFRQINMSETMRVNVPLVLVGDSAAVKALGGTLVHQMDEVEIECLPKDLVANIEVSVASLATFEDKVTVADIQVPAGVKILSDMDAVVAMVEAPRSEEELAALNQAVEVDVSKIEVLTEKKKDEEAAEAPKA